MSIFLFFINIFINIEYKDFLPNYRFAQYKCTLHYLMLCDKCSGVKSLDVYS